jgi:two-component system nitrogen regulation response regulator GlnG
MPRLLLIDDEPIIQHAFRKAFHAPEYETVAVRTCADGLACLAANRPDVVVLDVHLPDADGLTAFDRIKAADARTPVILITGHGSTELAIEAMKRGAFDFLLKPLRYEQLRELVARACESSRLMNVPAVLPDASAPAEAGDVLVGRCSPMQEVYKQVGRVAATDASVLILGESGTGKELIARAIYQHSGRSKLNFLAVNCGAIPEGLIESELFGHERGAFTGADVKRIGKFEQCHGGTLFLDEIGEAPPLVQVKLLRVLQDQRFERVGGIETVATDVRLIAATNTDLEKLVVKGTFRSDLYFRLKGFTIRLPALRDRGDDLDLLVDHFVGRYSREFRKPVAVLADDARAALRSYPWPGNIRELQSVLKQGILQMSGSVLLKDYLPIGRAAGPAEMPTVPPDRTGIDWDTFVSARLAAGAEDLYAECVTAMERQLLSRVLQKTNGNQLKAAEILGITRGTLRAKVRALGISLEKETAADPNPAD